MYFEVSERLITNESPEAVMAFAKDSFARISKRSGIRNGVIDVEMVEASFGSANRYDRTLIKMNRINGGYVLVSETKYRPTFLFWLFLAVLIFTYIGWIIPIVFYLSQRGTVRNAIQAVMNRVVNEFEVLPTQLIATAGPSKADELRKLADLRESGHLTDEEFQSQKAHLLQS